MMNNPQGLPVAHSNGNDLYQSGNYQDEIESHDSRLKASWDDNMGDLKERVVSYRKAFVLLLSWDKTVDDLHTDEEVKLLAAVFQKTFNYKIVPKVLTKDARRKAQVQVNRHLAEFVDEYDDTNTLLIVYYAGHGKRVEPHGSMILEASRSFLPDESSNLHEIVWNSAEHNIKDTKSDVLVIFDCCEAGALDQNVRSANTRAFEFLAATSANSTTRKPGPESFTSALIWALERLGNTGKRFATRELVTQILQAPKFPQNQVPRIGERDTISVRKIVLAPLKPEDTSYTREDSIDETDSPLFEREDLSVRFVFRKKISTAVVKNLSIGIRRLLTEGDFDATTVLWEGINSLRPIHAKSPLLHQAAGKFLAVLHRKKGSLNTSPVQEVPVQSVELSSSEDSLIETPERTLQDEDAALVLCDTGMDVEAVSTASPIEMDLKSNIPFQPSPSKLKRKRLNGVVNGGVPNSIDTKRASTRTFKRSKVEDQQIPRQN
ncbi:tyrosine-protein phosphatase non-receptor type 6 [Phlyctema vagabunda]|uniref:Tyrosine-protein phosphatase non-receptor type 6 n=1 Tax=Phlyctema vagabunda TaxID=108571 RepID=A0ABR4PAZ0_9HELO